MQIEKRSLAGSDAYFVQNGQPAWSDWNIGKAVDEGYQANPWVFRAIQIITQNAASVPWVVFDKKMSPLYDHHLSKLFAKPNPVYPQQRMMELVVAWLELGGNAYWKKVMVGGRTAEIWPVSPDRCAPIPSKDPVEFVSGYKIKAEGGREVVDPEWNLSTVVHFSFTNPANPYLGISPLGAAAKATDLDNTQISWNVATMQNRGVVDGLFSFKRMLETAQATSIMDRIKEKWSGTKNARKPLVIGDEVTFTKLALTPVEMDFLASRKSNREEILSVFGVPPQLVGSQEASTYSNFSAALRIMWKGTILPILDMMKSCMNHSFSGELQNGCTIGYDASEVPALQENEAEKIATARVLFLMGVPVSIINEKLALGIPEYPGWNIGRGVAGDSKTPAEGADDPDKEPPLKLPTGKGGATGGEGERSFDLVPLEQRSADGDAKLRDSLAEGRVFNAVNTLLSKQGEAVIAAIGAGRDAMLEAKKFSDEWVTVLSEEYAAVAYQMAMRVVTPRAAAGGCEMRENIPYDEQLLDAIRTALSLEGIVLTDLAFIESTMVQTILTQTEYTLANGLPYSALAQALTDTGLFSPERALRIARTTAGAAASIGQLEAGKQAGATHKKWLTSKLETRDAHAARDNEVVEVDKRFSKQISAVGPRYPLDPELSAADRINCRCFMSFSFKKDD